MPFDPQVVSGFPLRTIDNGDGTATLVVDAVITPEIDQTPKINQPLVVANTTPGTEQTLVDYVVPAGKKHAIVKAFFSCRVEGLAKVYLGSVLSYTTRTSAATPNAIIDLSPLSDSAPAGTEVKTTFTARLNSAVTQVESKIVGFEINA